MVNWIIVGMLPYKLSMIMSYVLIAVSLYSRVHSFPRTALKTIPQIGCLERSRIFSPPSVLEARGSKSRCWLGWFLLSLWRRVSSMVLSCWKFLTFLGLQAHYFSLCLCLQITFFSVCVSESEFLSSDMDNNHIGFRALRYSNMTSC